VCVYVYTSFNVTVYSSCNFKEVITIKLRNYVYTSFNVTVYSSCNFKEVITIKLRN